MACFKFNFVLFINFLSIFKVSLLETVHFTNSANKILRANNYTTYKVEVPNGDPITIIEANTPLINKNIKFDEVENSKYSINQNRDNKNHVMDLKTSLSMTVTPHKNNDEYENLPSGEEESVTSDYSSNSSPEYVHHQHTMKTVYSPELLQKFLKDYANKIHSTEPASQPPPTQESITQVNYADTMEDKYESIEAEEEDGNRRVSNINESKEHDGPNHVQERKRHRPGDKSNYEHPYNKNNGWVTLEAVPWSKSKVSKWQSSVKPYGTQNNYNYQSNSNNAPYQRPPRPPPYNYEEDNEDDYYSSHKPSRPTYQNNQYYGGGSSSHNKPNPEPLYSHHSQQSSHHSSSFNNNYDNDYRPSRPNQPEIITDNRPANFPNQNTYESSYDYNPNRPNSYDSRPNRPYNDNPYSSGPSYNPYSNKDGPHPLSYPNGGGDGEWVLVSTTKGYQFPKRHGQRAMMFQAQNGISGTDTRKNDNKGIITAAASQQYETSVSIKPSFQVGPTKTTQQQVKLTVLPLFTKKNENKPYQGHQQNYNNMEVGVYKPSNYNGVIETEPSTQTIEESVAATATANKVNSSPGNAQKTTKKTKRKQMKNYAVMRKNPGGDSTAVLAAVGII